MTQIPQDEASKEKLQILLFQLGELLKDPPAVINLPDWRGNIEDVMDEIGVLSPFARERLQDLIIGGYGEVRSMSMTSIKEPPRMIQRGVSMSILLRLHL